MNVIVSTICGVDLGAEYIEEDGERALFINLFILRFVIFFE